MNTNTQNPDKQIFHNCHNIIHKYAKIYYRTNQKNIINIIMEASKHIIYLYHAFNTSSNIEHDYYINIEKNKNLQPFMNILTNAEKELFTHNYNLICEIFKM